MKDIYLIYTFAFVNPCYFFHYPKELSSMNLKVEVTVFLFVKFKEHLKFIAIRKAIWCNNLALFQLSQSLTQVW